MKRGFIFLLLVMLVVTFSSSSWAQFPCNPGDSAVSCCGADSGSGGYSYDLGFCDTLHVVPWPFTDTCFAGDCDNYKINEPGEYFPCFLYVSLFVTHDSNTFYSVPHDFKIQDSLAAFVLPLHFWHEGCAEKVILPKPAAPAWFNNNDNATSGRSGRSIFRDFVNTHTDPPETTFNRMFWLGDNYLGWATRITDIDSLSCDGDTGHGFLSLAPTDPSNRRWWEGERVLLATWTFIVYKSAGCDTVEMCIDSTLWAPTGHLTLTRMDGLVYRVRHELPLCLLIHEDTVWVRISEGPTITVSPESVDFDSVEVGDSSDTVITITNDGTAALNIDSATVSTGAFVILTDPSGYSIDPASSDTFSVRFAPLDTGLFEDTLKIWSDAVEGDGEVPLSGIGYPATGVRWIEDLPEEEGKPIIFSISQNYPNPFNPVTNFEVVLPKPSHVKMEIFNILGQKVKTLVDENLRAGVFIVDWDGTDERGLEVSSGIYFYQIITDDFSDIKKMVLMK